MYNVFNKKKVSTMLMLSILALSIIPLFAIPVIAEPVPKPGIVDWVAGGEAVHNSLACDPEWLKVWTVTHVDHDTWIHVLGKDTYDQDVEAKVLIPASTGIQQKFPLIDIHSGLPVTFAKITGVFQQGGTHCNIFQVHTLPEPEQDYLGLYHTATGYEPNIDNATGYPVEPSNPDPLKIVINWDDDGDGILEEDEVGYPLVDSTITIKGLDQYGNILEHTVTIPAGPWPAGTWFVPVDITCHTWSTVCTVMGGLSGISYYIFTHPKGQRPIFEYKLAVDRIEVTADPKNILADGNSTSEITITLLDQDGHEIHWTPNADPVEVNVAATGGKVVPSLGIEIPGCSTHAHTNLTSDTNARIVRVTALAIVPESPGHAATQKFGEDKVCFDGINSVPYKKNFDIIDIGGTGTGKHYAVFKKLEKGCNLISIPVIPDETLNWTDLPCASQSLISVATYIAPFCPNDTGTWLYYDFRQGTGDDIPIVDGWAYWVKTEKPCTLVMSGRVMDQYDNATGFGLPPMYFMGIGWNFVGVTALRWINTADYLESLNVDQALKLYGPVWVYRRTATDGVWSRNPLTLMPTEGMWLFTYDGILAP